MWNYILQIPLNMLAVANLDKGSFPISRASLRIALPDANMSTVTPLARQMSPVSNPLLTLTSPDGVSLTYCTSGNDKQWLSTNSPFDCFPAHTFTSQCIPTTSLAPIPGSSTGVSEPQRGPHCILTRVGLETWARGKRIEGGGNGRNRPAYWERAPH